MSRLKKRFEALRKQGRKALIPFITAGDPAPGATVPLMHAMVAAGADAVELGVPFSDPMADGPVIQRANERAMVHGVRLTDVLAMAQEFRKQDSDTPVIFMGYLNPVEIMGYAAFAKAAKAADIDGLITVDLPPEEGGELVSALRSKRIDPIFLLAPTSNNGRIKRICKLAAGFVYYVSLKGVTGSSALKVAAVRKKLAKIRKHTDLPVGVGFGISDAKTAAEISEISDAVVVGSALVRKFEELDQQAALKAIPALLADMRHAMDEAA